MRGAVILTAVATVVAFLPALGHDFVDWDDTQNFLQNPHYRGLGVAQLRWMLTTGHLGHWVPVTWLTLGLDYLVWGMRPMGYHLTNVALHAATAAAAVCLFARLLVAAGGVDRAAALAGGVAGALVFAIHPLRVESVAWVTERRDVLSGLFYVLALLAYVHAAARPADVPGWRCRAYWLSLAAFAAALLSKAIVLTLPAVLVVLDVYPLRRRAWREKIPYVALALAIAVVTLIVRVGEAPARGFEEFGVVPRLAVAAYSLAFYLWKTVAPFGLSPLYEMPARLNPVAWPFVGSAIVVALLTWLAIAVRHRVPALTAAWVVYVVTVLPVSGLLHNGPQLAADRYTYLACLPWALLAGALVAHGAAAWRDGRLPSSSSLALAAAGLGIVGTLAVLTWNQTGVWRDTETLWRHAAAVAPSARANAALADLRVGQTRPTEAVDLAQRALALDPRSVDARNTLGLAFAQRGELARAVEEFRRAVRGAPTHAVSRNNLGVALAQQERWDEAVRELREAVRLKPDYADANRNLGLALIRLGRPEEARPFLELAERLGAGTSARTR